MKAGFGKAKVTPPLGMPMEGLGQIEGCKSIHDDLWCRILALQNGRKRFLIVALDLLFLERAAVDRVKASLFRQFGMPPDAVLLNSSHTHAGPRVSSWAYSDGPDPRYLHFVEEAILSASEKALTSMRNVDISAAAGLTDLPVSRRKVGPDGVAQWAPCRSAEVCRHLPFCVFRGKNRDVVAVLFSVSCHPSMIYSPDISADYPGAAVRHLNRRLGTEGSIFLQGAGGDTKPRQIAVDEERWRHGTWEDVDAAGREVADGVKAAMDRGMMSVQPCLAHMLIEIHWPLARAPSRRALDRVALDPRIAEAKRRWAEDMLRTIEVRGRLPDAAPVQIHAVRIGRGLRLVGLEGELVGEFGNLIVNHFSRGITFPLGYTNGAQIYLPTSRMIGERGYEVDSYWEYHWPAPLRPVTDNVLRLALGRVRAI